MSNNSYHSDLCPQCRDPWCHGCPTNAEFHAERDVAHRVQHAWTAEQQLQRLEEYIWKKYQSKQGTPGWPPTAQETVHYQEVMSKPDEF
jgi:hypothetical protein